jgi:glutathione S-transferase
MRYRLYYWPEIQGRGEFIRLALEDAGADYLDVLRFSSSAFLKYPDLKRPPFAPPYLVAGKKVIAQTANILQYLGPRLRLAPKDEAGRLWVHQLQLTIADWLVEVHDTHHPIGSGLYYEEQRREAKRRAADFLAVRLPKYLDYFDGVLRRARGGYLLGKACSYADLSLFQMVAGLRYAFPVGSSGAMRASSGSTTGWRRVRAWLLTSPPSGASHSTGKAFSGTIPSSTWLEKNQKKHRPGPLFGDIKTGCEKKPWTGPRTESKR